MKQPEPKREKTIKVRVSADEYETLKRHCTRHQLAAWMREQCLNPGGDLVRKKAPQPPAVDPQLLRQLSGIGNNLNQMARVVNRTDTAPLDRVRTVAALNEIRDELKKIREQHQ